jgi:hypothetical protein
VKLKFEKVELTALLARRDHVQLLSKVLLALKEPYNDLASFKQLDKHDNS